MADVARVCGLSRPAVSMALAGKRGEVSEETRRRVQQAAERLGYRPNTVARAVRSGRFQAIALLIDRNSYLPRELLTGLASACAGRGQHLVVAESADAELVGATSPSKILDHLLADSLLINRHDPPSAAVQARLAAGRMPLRWLNQRLGRCCIHPDDRAAGRGLVDALVGFGHRRIAYSQLIKHADPEPHYSLIDRLAGHRDGLRAHGLADILHHDGSGLEDGMERIASAREFLARPGRPTAVVCNGGVAVYAFHMAALGLGLRVPADLSLVAHVEGHHIDATGLELGGIAVPWGAVAEAAVATLISSGSHQPDAPDVAVQPGRFDPRDTCARCPG